MSPGVGVPIWISGQLATPIAGDWPRLCHPFRCWAGSEEHDEYAVNTTQRKKSPCQPGDREQFFQLNGRRPFNEFVSKATSSKLTIKGPILGSNLGAPITPQLTSASTAGHRDLVKSPRHPERLHLGIPPNDPGTDSTANSKLIPGDFDAGIGRISPGIAVIVDLAPLKASFVRRVGTNRFANRSSCSWIGDRPFLSFEPPAPPRGRLWMMFPPTLLIALRTDSVLVTSPAPGMWRHLTETGSVLAKNFRR